MPFFYKSTNKKYWYNTLILLFFFVFVSSFFIGPTHLKSFSTIISLRVPRVLTGFFIGAILSLFGSFLQSLFLNPLVSPYTLGSASMAGMGASISMFLGIHPSIGAIIASMLHAGAMYWSALSFKSNVSSIILVGVALSFLSGAVIMFLQYIAPYTVGISSLHWLMGDLAFVTWSDTIILFFVFGGSLFLFIYSRELDLLQLGDLEAMASGVSVRNLTLIVLTIISILLGISISISGPIPFIGLFAPHIARRLGFRDTLNNSIIAMLLGSMILLVSDDISRILLPGEIPIGIITTLIGAPFFLFLVLYKNY